MTLHQVHRLVQLALGATAVGFAALAGTLRKSAPKKPLAGGQLGNAGPEVAFGGREFGADEGFGHILYHILYKIGTKSKSKNAIRICSSLGSGLKHLSNQTIWRAKEFGCGIAGLYGIFCHRSEECRIFRTRLELVPSQNVGTYQQHPTKRKGKSYPNLLQRLLLRRPPTTTGRE